MDFIRHASALPDATPSCTLETLPVEVRIDIMTNLPAKSIFNLCTTSRTLNQTFTDNRGYIMREIVATQHSQLRRVLRPELYPKDLRHLNDIEHSCEAATDVSLSLVGRAFLSSTSPDISISALQAVRLIPYLLLLDDFLDRYRTELLRLPNAINFRPHQTHPSFINYLWFPVGTHLPKYLMDCKTFRRAKDGSPIIARQEMRSAIEGNILTTQYTQEAVHRLCVVYDWLDREVHYMLRLKFSLRAPGIYGDLCMGYLPYGGLTVIAHILTMSPRLILSSGPMDFSKVHLPLSAQTFDMTSRIWLDLKPSLSLFASYHGCRIFAPHEIMNMRTQLPHDLEHEDAELNLFN